MTAAAQAQAEVLDELRSVWRIRAALALLRASADIRLNAGASLSYANVPKAGGVELFSSAEPVRTALDSTREYENDRMQVDTLLVLLAPVERFLSSKLADAGERPEGTFGNLQLRAQRLHGVAGSVVLQMNEIRERRNCHIHHLGIATDRYVAAAVEAGPHSGGTVVPPALGSMVGIGWNYLGYAAGVIVDYIGKFP